MALINRLLQYMLGFLRVALLWESPASIQPCRVGTWSGMFCGSVTFFNKYKVYILLLLLLFNRLPQDITRGQGLKNNIINFFSILQYWYWYGRLYKKKFRTLISIGFVSPPLIFRIRRRRGRFLSLPVCRRSNLLTGEGWTQGWRGWVRS